MERGPKGPRMAHCYPMVLAFPVGLSPHAHPRHSTGAADTFLASKSGCTRTSAQATDTQSSTRTGPSRTHFVAMLPSSPWHLSPHPRRSDFIAQPASRAPPRSSRTAEGTWLWKLSPLCPLSRTITQGPPPATGVISWRAPERRALTSPLSPSRLRICPPPICQPVTEHKQRPHLGLLPPPGWLGLGAQGTWGYSSQRDPTRGLGPQSPHSFAPAHTGVESPLASPAATEGTSEAWVPLTLDPTAPYTATNWASSRPVWRWS